MFWIVQSGIIAASSVVLARYCAYFIPESEPGIRLTAIGFILMLSFVNYIGIEQGSAVQTIATCAKVFAVVVILAFVFAFAGPKFEGFHASAASPSWLEFAIAIGAALFTFGGWHMVSYAAGETREPAKTIPRALLIGTLIVVVCYIGINAAYLHLLPIQKVISSTRVAADAATVVAGPRGAACVAALVILSSLGVLNGVILAGPRLYFAMAREDWVFRWMGVIHPRFHTPHVAILLQAVWSSFLVASSTYRDLFTRVVYTEWLFFALMTLGLFRLRRSATYAPGYRVWGYPVVPLAFMVGAVIVACCQIAADPWKACSGLALIVVGWLVYRLGVYPSRSQR